MSRKWRLRILLWTGSSLVGFLIRSTWSLSILLALFIVVTFVAAMLRSAGWASASRIERWSKDQFWARLREVAMFTMLPTAIVAARGLIQRPSTSAVSELVVVLVAMGVIWAGFDMLREHWSWEPHSARRRRRRR